jgi:RimJ/RimL family protein N-acetyltransferase
MEVQTITLRRTIISDLEQFFLFQLDDEARRLAAFTNKDSLDKAAYIERYTTYLPDPAKNMQTILVGDVIAGSISKFEMGGESHITYWMAKSFWGQGVATTALKLFLEIEIIRPIFAGVAFDNIGSQKVLEKCGFIKIGTDKGFANARGAEIEEYVYKLSV